MNINAVLRLIRFHKPVGTLLLWFPTAWALWLAHGNNTPPWFLVMLFFLGTFLMRSAGCIVNDIADRHVDCHVQRTNTRPLTTGEITLPEAFTWLIVFLFMAFMVLVQLPRACFYDALAALVITAIYPFCKRFFQAPQLMLGLAFSMGIPMAYAALNVTPDLTMMLLLVLNFLWIIAYDTLYAMADRADDLRIGIRSTAILFGRHWQPIVYTLQSIAHSLWLMIAYIHHASLGFYLLWSGAVMVFVYQHTLIQRAHAHTYLRAFSTHALYGFIMWLGCIVLCLKP